MMAAGGSGRPGLRAPVGRDVGSVTLFLVIAAVGLLAMAGLAVDGGAKVRAAQRADRIAGEAARAAGAALSRQGVLSGVVRVDRRAAIEAVSQYLAEAGVQGRAELLESGRAVRVDTTVHQSTVFLGLIGISGFEVHGSATAEVVQG